jgi:D-inositol-3-phosphate glycosyltransferase
MRKLALVVPSLTNGGGVPSVARFVRDAALSSRRFELKIVSLCMDSYEVGSRMISAPSTWLTGPSATTGEWEGLPFTHVGANWAELEMQRYRRREVLSEALAECDLIQVVCGSPAWANAVIGLGKPVSLQVATRAKVERRRRDADPRSLVGWWRKAMTQFTDRLDDRGLRGVDAIQLENSWMLDYSKQLNQGNTDIDIRYAPPGVNAKLFSPPPHRCSASNPYILCVGRLDDPRKNIGLLLEAFGLLPARLAHVHLVTAGAGGPPPDYWARVAAMGLQGRVRHVQRPATQDLVRLYQDAAVFALASDEEGLGVVILEAMACGVPVVATRCGGPDGIITDGKDGFLVSLDDASDMAHRLATLCIDADLNRTMGRQARQTIETRYAEDVAGQAFVDVWERLLQKAGQR